MSIGFHPTAPVDRHHGDLEMGEVIRRLAEMTEGAKTPEEVVARLVADGASVEAPEGILTNWIELRFEHLIGMFQIMDRPFADKMDYFRISGHESNCSEPWIVLTNLDPLLAQVHAHSWKGFDITALAEVGYFDSEPEIGDRWPLASEWTNDMLAAEYGTGKDA